MEKGVTESALNTKDVPEMITNTAPRILMIVTDKDGLDADKEAKLRNMLVTNYNAVVEIAESSADVDVGNWDLKRYDLIIVCNGVAPADVNDLKSVEVPVLSLDEDVSITALNMASTGGNSASETATNVTDITHQITSEALRDINPENIATGNKSVYTTASGIDFITTLGTGGDSLTEDTGTATEEHTVVYDEGAALQDATLAEEIRIHFGLYQYNKLNSTGRELLKHAINYAIYGPMMSPMVSIETDVETVITNQSYNQNFGIRVGGFLPQGQPIGEGIFVDASVTTSGNGLGWSAALKTIAEGDALVTDGNDDYVFVKKGDYDEDASVNGVAITKNSHYIAVGLGLATVDNSVGSALYVFYVTSPDVEIAGFIIDETTTTVEGIVVTGTTVDGYFIHDNTFIGAMENGIRIEVTTSIVNNVPGIIYKNNIRGVTNDGIEFGTSDGGNYAIVVENYIYDAGDNGIHLTATGTTLKEIVHNTIHGGGGTTDYAINVAGSENFIDWNSMGDLGTSPILDSGSNNYWGPHNGADSISGSYNRTVANGVAEITSNVTNIDLWASGEYEFQWDLSTLISASEGGNVDCFIYSKVGSTFIRRDIDRMVINTDVIHPTCKKSFVGGDSQLQEGLQCSVVTTASRLIYWRLIKC